LAWGQDPVNSWGMEPISDVRMEFMIARNRLSRAGMTLIELLVVIAIIGVLLGLLMPAIQFARNSARRSQCLSQLRQIGLAMETYMEVRGTRAPYPTWPNCRPPHRPVS